jgi:hypothetical protein
MEIVILFIVALSFGRAARTASRRAVAWAVAGGALYACSLFAAKALFMILLLPIRDNASLCMAIDIFFSNAIALLVVFWCGHSLFGVSVLKAEQPFKVFNWTWLILVSFIVLPLMTNPPPGGPVFFASLAVAGFIPAGTLFAGIRDRKSGEISRPGWSLPMLLLNAIATAPVIYHFSTNEIYHPIAFFIVDMYFSLWLITLAAFNAVVLFGIHQSSRRTNFTQSEQERT